MTLEADTKIVEDALETVKLVGATGVDSPRVRRDGKQTAQSENCEELTPAESAFVPQVGDEVGVCRPGQG